MMVLAFVLAGLAVLCFVAGYGIDAVGKHRREAYAINNRSFRRFNR